MIKGAIHGRSWNYYSSPVGNKPDLKFEPRVSACFEYNGDDFRFTQRHFTITTKIPDDF